MMITVLLWCALILLMIRSLLLEWPNPRAFYYLYKIHGLWGWPFVGSVPLFMRLKEEEFLPQFFKMAKMYPRITSYSMGGLPEVLMQEPDDIQRLLNSMDYITKGAEYRVTWPWLKEGLLTSDGQKWRSRRKLLTPAFHFRILEDSLAGMNRNARMMVEKLAATKGKTVEIQDLTSTCALNVVTEAAMGISLENAGEGEKYVANIKWITKMLMIRILNAVQFPDFPFLWLRKGRLFMKKIFQVHHFTQKIINDRRQKALSNEIDSPESGKKRLVFLDCLLEMEQSNPGSLNDEGIREEVDTFMFEGHDTTASALTFSVYNVGRHQEVQERLRSELGEIFEGSDRDVTLSDISRMTYLEKVIKETLRLYPSVPGFTRRISKDLILDGGIVIPAGCNVAIIVFLLHWNPKLYPDPERFDPERFSEDQVAARHPFAYLPFSAGPRNCIGQKFAMMELKVTLCHLIRNLQVTSLTEEKDIKLVPQLILNTLTPLEFQFTKINS